MNLTQIDKPKLLKREGFDLLSIVKRINQLKKWILEEDSIRKKVKMQYHQFDAKFDEASIQVKTINNFSEFESS